MISILIAAAFLAACDTPAPARTADLVLVNGGIYTVDADRSWADAAAVIGKRIVAVGDSDDIRSMIGEATRVIDLDGRMAMPGMHDSHIHPLEGAYEQVDCDVSTAESPAVITALLQHCVPADPGKWFSGVGLDLGMFGLTGPDKSLLDGVSPGSYIFIDGADGHAALVNDAVLALAGIDANTPDPDRGVIERRGDGAEPNGTVREAARDLVDALRPPRSLEVSTPAMRKAIALINSLGITAVVDMWAGEHEFSIYKSLDDAGELSLRVNSALIDEGVFEKHVGDDFERVLAARNRYESEHINNDAIKFMVDGVFEGETGSVLEPYSSTGDLGVLNREPDDLKRRALRYYDMGLQLHFHTMGDGAVREALDALEYARENGSPSHLGLRHSLSHLGLIDPADMPRFAKLNTAASFTLAWGYTDEWTVNLEIPTLGLQRVKRLYPVRSVAAAGAVIVGGSDWNYGPLDPLVSIEAGVTRSDPYGPSDYEQYIEEAVALVQMIDAYTINGAWLAQRDQQLGSIEPGKLADIVVFDRNLFDIDPAEISEAVVDLTIFDGRIVYDRNSGGGRH